MKNLKIIALVIAAHVAGLAVLLTVQGCRSTTAAPDRVAAASSEESAAPVAPVVRAETPLFQPIAVNPPGATAPAPAMPPTDRFAPTRPGSAAAVETLPAQNYVVKKNDNLGSIARRHGISKDELVRANNLSSSTILKIGQKLIIPSPKAAGVGAGTDASVATSGGQTYKVRSGDTLGGIARRHGVPLNALRVANGLANDNIGVGQELRIPGTATSGSSPLSGNDPAAKPGAGVTPPATGASDVGPRSSLGTTTRGAGRHTVALGETIGDIAKRYRVSTVAIMTANNITNPKSIRPGQELIVPGAAGLAAPPQPAVEAPPSLEPSSEPPPVKPAGGSDAPVLPTDDAPPVVPVG